MEDRDILLRIRREFSKDEKYRYLLHYLDGVEISRKRERQLNTDLMNLVEQLQSRVKELEQLPPAEVKELKRLRKLQSAGNFISPDRYQQVCKERNEFRKKYHEQVEKNISQERGVFLSPVALERDMQERLLKRIFPGYPDSAAKWQYMNGLIANAFGCKRQVSLQELDQPNQ